MKVRGVLVDGVDAVLQSWRNNGGDTRPALQCPAMRTLTAGEGLMCSAEEAAALGPLAAEEAVDVFRCVAVEPFLTILTRSADSCAEETPVSVRSAFLRLGAAYSEAAGLLQLLCDSVLGMRVERVLRRIRAMLCGLLLHRDVNTLATSTVGALFSSFLVSHAHAVVRSSSLALPNGSEDSPDGDGASSAARGDPVAEVLRLLGMARHPVVMHTRMSALHAAAAARVDAALAEAEEEGEVRAVAADISEWCEGTGTHVITLGLWAPLPSSTAAEDEAAEVAPRVHALRAGALRHLARRLTGNIFDIIVDFPDSMPHLGDLHLCVNAQPDTRLAEEIAAAARAVLASRLHHAGTQTDDVLAVMVSAIRALTVVFASREHASLVLSAVGGTVAHVRARRDAVRCIMKVLTDPNTDPYLQDEFRRFGAGGASQPGAVPDEDVPETRGRAKIGQSLQSQYSWQRHQRPQALRVLLSAVPLPNFVAEYQSMLAAQLLSKTSYDATAEEEVLERMKCLLGDEPLSACAVMLRDVQQSRRTHASMAAHVQARQGQDQTTGAAPTAPGVFAPFAAGLTVVSHTKWPSMDPDRLFPPSFALHPSLASTLEAMGQAFHAVKPSMKLKPIATHGVVQLEVRQLAPRSATTPTHISSHVTTTFAVNPLVASAVLHIKGAGGEMPMADLCAALKITKADEGLLVRQLQPHQPTLVVIDAKRGTVAVQRHADAGTVAVEEEEAPDANPAPTGLSEEQLTVLTKLVKAMLKTAKNGKPAAAIGNSLKALGSFSGTTQEMRAVLEYLTGTGVLVACGPDTFKLA